MLRILLFLFLLCATSGCSEAPEISTSVLARKQVAPTADPTQRALNQASGSRARVIVKFRKRSAPVGDELSRAAWVSGKLGSRVRHGRALGEFTQSMHADSLSTTGLIQALEVLPEVEWVVEDRRHRIRSMPNDPLFFAGQPRSGTVEAGQWFLRTPSSLTPAAIDALRAWDRQKGNPQVVVAVLDSGVLLNHPDLVAKVRPGYDFVSDLSSAADGTRRDTDPNDPGDATVAGECDPSEPATESSWHGTQVAGLIGAATDNGIGIASAGHDVSVLPVRVLGKCGGYDSDIIAGMLWAAGLSTNVGFGRPVNYPNPFPASVLNLSFGSQGTCSRSYADAMAQLNQKGVTVVAAAGNDAGLPVSTPANCSGVIAVAGIRHIGTKVGYSNIGAEVSISAPAGNCVNLGGPCLYPLVTTTNSGRRTPESNTYSDAFNTSVGTSFAAPLVSATVALMLSANPGLSPANIRSMLKRTARPFPTTGAQSDVSVCDKPSGREQLECYCTTRTCGAGLLSTYNAVRLAADLALTQSAYRDNADLYDPETGQLQIGQVDVGSDRFHNVVVTIDQVLALGNQAGPDYPISRFDRSKGVLEVAQVRVNTALFYNVTVTLKEVLQIGVPD